MKALYILTKDLIQRYCYSQSYTKGMSYYKRGKVFNLKVDEEGDLKSEYFLSIYADVEGSEGELYSVEVDFSSEDGLPFLTAPVLPLKTFVKVKSFVNT